MMAVVQMRRIALRFGVDIDCSPTSILSGKYAGATAFVCNDGISGQYCLFRQKEEKIKLVPDWNNWRNGDCADAIATAKAGGTPSREFVRQVRECMETEILV